MSDFYLRAKDPLEPVYEVDRYAGRWRLAASKIGALPVGGALSEGGDTFAPPDFVQVWPKSSSGDVVIFTTEKPD